MQSAVNAAAQHGGGWVQLVFHEICSQTLDPSNYSFCINDWGPIELDTLNQLLTWLQNSGQPGGAPPRTAIETVSQVMNGPDTQAPVTTLECDNTPCQSTTYHGSTSVSLIGKDPGGSGVAATYYTTDGSTPTTASPKFTHPFTISQPTTFKFFSVDNSGNVEAMHVQDVQVAPNADPIIGSAGDIACDPTQIAFNNGQGTSTDCRAAHTANLLDGVDAVLPLGDDQYNCGGASAFAQSYDPTWGTKKSITHPVPGDADYATTGGTDCPTTPGAGYYQYFGASAGDPSKGYYSYNLGQWHIVAINTAPCEDNAATCQAGSAQDQWLQQDLAANTASCTLAYYQNPRFVSTPGGGNDFLQAIWQDLYNGGVDVVLNGDSHWYERFAPINASGASDPNNGIREFIVGTGGQGLDTPAAQLPTSQVVNNSTHGVVRMTLHNGSYDWNFVPDEGTFTDSGTGNCHGRPLSADTTAPTTTAACNGAACQTGWYNAGVQTTLLPTDNPGGSGVKATYYTTNGTTPTTSSPTYTGPLTVASTTTVKYFSVDNAGNAEPVQTQVVQVDGAPPTQCDRCKHARAFERLVHRVREDYPGAVGQHRRLGSRGDVLHDGRLDADRLEHEVHGRFPGGQHVNRKVLLGRRGRRCRGGQVATGPGRRCPADDHDQLQRRGLSDIGVPQRGHSVTRRSRQLRRLGDREHPLHHERHDADAHQSGVHGALLGERDDHRDLPIVGCRGQRRGSQEPGRQDPGPAAGRRAHGDPDQRGSAVLGDSQRFRLN
jgi:hypothetical protein